VGAASVNNAVGIPTPLVRARAVPENDGNAHITFEKTWLGSMYEIGERLLSWMPVQLTLPEDPAEGLPQLRGRSMNGIWVRSIRGWFIQFQFLNL